MVSESLAAPAAAPPAEASASLCSLAVGPWSVGAAAVSGEPRLAAMAAALASSSASAAPSFWSDSAASVTTPWFSPSWSRSLAPTSPITSSSLDFLSASLDASSFSWLDVWSAWPWAPSIGVPLRPSSSPSS
eukprot:5490044-Pyramimonas_sp.AAC.1